MRKHRYREEASGQERVPQERITIACAGCGRTQTLRRSKVIVCDAYWCGVGSCNLHPEIQHPAPPDGYVCEVEMYAAGGFSGHTMRPATDVDRMVIKRAQRILERGMAMMGDV
jgi:hypothetical protein